MGLANLSEPPTWDDTGLKMTIHPKTRDVARRLLQCEARSAKHSESTETATLRVYEKLRRRLGEFAGAAGFQSLASRALVLARSEAPSLSTARVSADGALLGLGEFESSIDIDKNQAGSDQVDEQGVVLIARLLGLLHIFLGEALTLSLLRNAWPGAVLDDHNAGSGRNA